MLFANYADGLSSMFNAFEKMEYPAGLATASGLLKVTLGAAVLLAGWGFVGLAAVSLTVNILQVFWLYGLVRRTLFQPQWQWDWSLQKWMFATSGPLMINHLLATIFWRIDLWILRPLAGAASIGLYSVSLKYLDGLNIIPSVFTFAIFPLMSRYARREGEGLLRSYVIAVRLLLMASLPIAMMTTFIAAPLVFIVGGGEFLNVPEVFRVFGPGDPLHGRLATGLAGDHLEHPHRLRQQRHPVCADRRGPAALSDPGLPLRRPLQRGGQHPAHPQLWLHRRRGGRRF